MKYWSKLPGNVRRGLLRLYVGVSIPWVLWFLYKIDYDSEHNHYKVQDDFFALIIVPIGAIVLFFIVGWIIEGFRDHSSANDAAGRSKRAENDQGGQASPAGGFSPEVRAIFEKLDFFFQNEKAQTDRLAEPFRSQVLGGASCDEVAGATGEFGTRLSNPIPVNGPIGELIYLSNLRVAQANTPIMFHRLGSIRGIDAFEIVSFDGAIWDFLFLDMYHPRKSRLSPPGYQIATGKDRKSMLFGTNEFVARFPNQLMDAISRTYDRSIGVKMRPKEVREAIERSKFKRPDAHQSTYGILCERCVPKTTEKAAIDLVGVGQTLAKILLDPDDCWRDVCKLREYEVPNAVATCEMAFVRAAIVKDAVDQVYSNNSRMELKAGVDKCVLETFTKEKDTKDTLDHYENKPLAVAAVEAVLFYEQHVFPLAQLADEFARRLSVPGVPSIEIEPLFEEVAAEALRLLKASKSMKETRAGFEANTQDR